ncbi:porin, partial [Aquibium sp. A9E412]|uniref:porin n=1 Tax=Aquibium sp. A9E412 TaxID=2976767 RepID=UPI0025AF61BF
GSHSWGGMYYGYQQRHLIGYRFEGGNGFFGALALEDDAHTPFAAGSDGYMPDVVAKIGVNQGWGAVWAAVGYDESFDGSVNTLNALTGTVNSGGFGAQVGAQINVPNMPGSSLRVIGYYADGAHSYNVGSPTINFAASTGGLFPVFQYNGALFGGAEWSILGSYNHQFTPTFGASVAVQYFNDLYIAGTDVSTGVDAWGAELSTVWTPIENFEIRTELHYDDVGEVVPGFDPDGTFSGYLRFTRYF